MQKFTNNSKIPLSLAIWLADDDYDHDDDPMTISATTLLKPIKEIVLARQSIELDKTADLSSLIMSSMGTAIHTAIENAWLKTNKVRANLIALGTPQSVTDRILVNPTDEMVKDDSICIYMEKRSYKQVGEFRISGKFDFVVNGALEDFKSCGVYSYIMGSNVEKYKQQGSLYRWLNPNIITEDLMSIQLIFTDWSKLGAVKDPKYPQSRILEQKLELMSLEQTQAFVVGITNKISQLKDASQEELPICSDAELWRTADTWKYYKDPTKTARSTKNFTNSAEANERLAKDGSVGTVIKFPGQVKKCEYCSVVSVCDQAKTMIKDGSLIL